jgi:hypothetical protein
VRNARGAATLPFVSAERERARLSLVWCRQRMGHQHCATLTWGVELWRAAATRHFFCFIVLACIRRLGRALRNATPITTLFPRLTICTRTTRSLGPAFSPSYCTPTTTTTTQLSRDFGHPPQRPRTQRVKACWVARSSCAASQGRTRDGASGAPPQRPRSLSAHLRSTRQKRSCSQAALARREQKRRGPAAPRVRPGTSCARQHSTCMPVYPSVPMCGRRTAARGPDPALTASRCLATRHDATLRRTPVCHTATARAHTSPHPSAFARQQQPWRLVHPDAGSVTGRQLPPVTGTVLKPGSKTGPCPSQ